MVSQANPPTHKEGRISRPLPFRFSPLRVEREGFLETVQTTWEKDVLGSPSYVWEEKIKNTKKALKEWIKKVASSPTNQRKEATK